MSNGTTLENRILEEYIAEGIIAIDAGGTILNYNKKAKEIFGLIGHYDDTHESGKIEDGDVIVIADTGLGSDDGDLDEATLREYGLSAEDCANCRGKGLLYIGRKGAPPYAWRMIDTSRREGASELRHVIDGVALCCRIDYDRSLTVIEVDDKKFEIDYLMDISNMALIRRGEIVFYQRKGYSSRRESIRDILNGRPFMGKERAFEISVIGNNILDYHKGSQAIQVFLDVASGARDSIETKELIAINGYFVMGYIQPINQGGKRVGALLIIEDISTLITSRKERDDALSELEKLKSIATKDFFPEICGISLAINETKRLAAKAAVSDANVIILGESGVGKSYIAKKIHEKSNRAQQSFVEINCSSIPSELIESELFGYAPGAFTNANRAGKKGLFEIAAGGTVFMDEIGDIPLSMQSKLLLFVQKRKFYKVGGTEEISVDIRIITATNKDIETEVREKRFREDLYYRLHVIPLYVEPLRNRREDLGILIDLFIEEQNGKSREAKTLSTGARKILMGYDYPGNIREMENILERAFVLCDGGIIYPEHLMLHKFPDGNNPACEESGKSLHEMMQEQEKKLILERLEQCDYNHTATYTSLQIGKTSFYEKLKHLGISG